jgi:hypothetical protein
MRERLIAGVCATFLALVALTWLIVVGVTIASGH